MEHSEQVRQARKIFDFMDAGTTAMVDQIYRNNVTDYTCREQLAKEKQSLFRQHPLNLGLSCRVPAPGDFFTDDFSGVPILVVRGRDNVLRAFMNVCRHRGAKVASGCGRGAHGFSCPYHAWSYGLDGALKAIPFGQGFGDVDKTQNGLVPLPLVEKYGMIWVTPTRGETVAIDDYLAGLQDDLASYGFDGYAHYETRVIKRRMNWKLVVDTFLESYHLPVLHKNTIAPILRGNLATFDPFGNNERLIFVRFSMDEMRRQPEQDWDLIKHTAVVNILFPNTVCIMQGDHLEMFHVYPDGDDVNESRMYVSLYTPEPAETNSARGHWDRNFDLLLRTVEDEDFPVGEDIQRSFTSGAQDHITFGRNEPGLAHFHRSVKQSLGLEVA